MQVCFRSVCAGACEDSLGIRQVARRRGCKLNLVLKVAARGLKASTKACAAENSGEEYQCCKLNPHPSDWYFWLHRKYRACRLLVSEENLKCM
jgi:hypothetical protein